MQSKTSTQQNMNNPIFVFIKIKLIAFIIVGLFAICEAQSLTYSTGDTNLYICDYPSKIYGKTSIVFVETIDTIAKVNIFSVYYDYEKVLKVKINYNPYSYKYLKREDKSIYIDGLKLECFNSETFKEKKKNSSKFYMLISPNFWNLNNKERLETLRKLSE